MRLIDASKQQWALDHRGTVQFLTNEKGRKTAVVLDIDDREELLEDLDDLAVIAERRGEDTIPHAEFKKGLKRRAVSH